MQNLKRRTFISGAACTAAAALAQSSDSKSPAAEDVLDRWQRETDLVSAPTYYEYLNDGDVRGLTSLINLEKAFEKVFREASEAKPEDTPMVWSLYNMGYIVKTRETLFSIDLVHRRAVEFAPMLDFALVTHNHNDHFHPALYRAMNGAGKLVISNFLDNYGGNSPQRCGGYTRQTKIFTVKDVKIRTALVDHNNYLLDYTTSFEIRSGNFTIYHTGDCGVGSEPKLNPAFGRPDLWLFFPGCGINVAKAVKRVRPKRVVFGHLWELGHAKWRLTTDMVRAAETAAKASCPDTAAALWGERII